MKVFNIKNKNYFKDIENHNISKINLLKMSDKNLNTINNSNYEIINTITLMWKLFKFTNTYNNILILIGDKLFSFNLNNKLNIMFIEDILYNELFKENNNFTIKKISINIDDTNYKILIYPGF